jgi:hypothetical protein
LGLPVAGAGPQRCPGRPKGPSGPSDWQKMIDQWRDNFFTPLHLEPLGKQLDRSKSQDFDWPNLNNENDIFKK